MYITGTEYLLQVGSVLGLLTVAYRFWLAVVAKSSTIAVALLYCRRD